MRDEPFVPFTGWSFFGMSALFWAAVGLLSSKDEFPMLGN
jgi:hypothetical protein